MTKKKKKNVRWQVCYLDFNNLNELFHDLKSEIVLYKTLTFLNKIISVLKNSILKSVTNV